MGLITESSLRTLFKKEVPRVFEVAPGDLITPSAKQYLKDLGIKVQMTEKDLERPVVENHYRDFKPSDRAVYPKYVSYYDGGFYENKPEHMTHLKSNKLVYKDDLRIVFRGKMDSLQSLIMDIQLKLARQNEHALVKELDLILELIRQTLRAEVIDQPIAITSLIGLDDAGLREHSHHPKEHYGIEHFIPDMGMGEQVIWLNLIRTSVREVELAAMQAFRTGHDVEREDIIRVFNRLSSAVYILMCRVRSGYYRKERSS